MRNSGPRLSEGFRKVNFTEDENKIIKFKHKILYCLVVKRMSGPSEERFLPTPEQLGIR